MTCSRPQHVGILAISFYTPGHQVSQQHMEAHDNCAGKYTTGLGQIAMSFCTDREDVVSLALTAATRLLEAYAIDPRDIGRLEVATESAVDRSKSIKSHLMQLFHATGNHNVEGVDRIHGCYAGTAALFDAVAWVESSAWDGRLAMVVATDVALYGPGPARATGGAGAVALLVGPDAPLVLDPLWRSTHADHTNEFCKPPAAAPFPVFDGPETVVQFLRAAECCYSTLCQRVDAPSASDSGCHGSPLTPSSSSSALRAIAAPGVLSQVDHFISHAPYSKIVHKAFAYLVNQDALRTLRHVALEAARSMKDAGAAFVPESPAPSTSSGIDAATHPHPASPHGSDPAVAAAEAALRAWAQSRRASAQQEAAEPSTLLSLPPPLLEPLSPGVVAEAVRVATTAEQGALWAQLDPYSCARLKDAGLEKRLLLNAQAEWKAKAADGCHAQRLIGNTYTASLYFGLAGLTDQQGSRLEGKRILLFAFGSGVVASMFSLVGRATSSSKFNLKAMSEKLCLSSILASRKDETAAAFSAAAERHEVAYSTVPFEPCAPLEDVVPGAYYLEGINKQFHRQYSRKPAVM